MTAVAELASSEAAHVVPACWGVDPELFFGAADSAEGHPVWGWEHRALAVCAGCPVRARCLAWALEFSPEEQYGVVGGMTAGQRRAVLRTTRQRPTRTSVTDTARDARRLRAAAVGLYEAGHGARWIAARLEVGERRVHRWLAAHHATRQLAAPTRVGVAG